MGTKRRRGHNEGTIYQRADGRWEARITIETGKRKSFYGDTRQEAAQQLNKALRERDQGLPAVLETQTLAQFMTSWLQHVGATIDQTTYERYEQLVRIHIVPSLGRYPLTKLTPQQVQTFYAKKLAEPRKPDAAPLTATTVHHMHTALHSALDAALRMGLVQRNVCDLVKPPRSRRREMRVFSPEQADQFLQAIADDRLEALYVLALSTGMRLGELLGLSWHEVDLDCGTLQVIRTAQRIRRQTPDTNGRRNETILKFPKTHRSRRRILIPPSTIQALRAHRKRQLEERLQAGEAWQEHDDLVFTNPSGTVLTRAQIYYAFNRILRTNRLPRIRPHDLRHTAATLLLLHNVPVKVVSEMLGHSSIAITLDLYGHVLPDMQRQAAEAMEKILRR